MALTSALLSLSTNSIYNVCVLLHELEGQATRTRVTKTDLTPRSVPFSDSHSLLVHVCLLHFHNRPTVYLFGPDDIIKDAE